MSNVTDFDAIKPKDDSNIDLLRGTEKCKNSERPVDSKWGVDWIEGENESKPIPNGPEPFVQDLSSTAVLMPKDETATVEEPERGNWGGRFDFLMSLLGYSVGLGNVWRFPYLCYSNGGGAFLFPFILMLILLGIPLMFLELGFGQYAGLGPAAIFDRICPLFHGLGFGMIMASATVALYYTVIIAWAILYLFMSITSEVPWQRCHKEWASEACYSYTDADECALTNGTFFNSTCFNSTVSEEMNLKEIVHNATKVTPSQDFFFNHVLNKSKGIEDIGAPQWKVALCLLLAWLLIFVALSKGARSIGKVVYFTALFPYAVLLILFFRGITLDGAVDGIIFYIVPDFEKLASAQVWKDAAVQIFFALSPAFGGLITLASYNKFHNNCLKDSLIVGIGNISTSIFAGFVIFAIIGYLAKELDTDVRNVVDQGAGLAFIVYPDVVTRLPVSPFWSFLFFFMLITLGMGSEFALMETVMAAVQDAYPSLRKKKVYVVGIVSILGFLGGLVITCRGGIYVLTVFDTYAASWSVFLMAGLECTIIAWIYGCDRFIGDIEMMLGESGRWWKVYFGAFWKYITPATVLILLFFNWAQYKPMAEGNSYVYPMWANAIGWLMAFCPVALITGFSIHKYRTEAPPDLPPLQKIKHLLKPSKAWGPAYSPPKFTLDNETEKKDPETITNPNYSENKISEPRIVNTFV